MKTGIKFLGMSFMAFALTACGGAPEPSAEAPAVVEEEVVEAPALMDYMIDTEKSVVNWGGEMMGMYQHTGTLTFSDGKITVENGAITGGMFNVDLATMSPTDENYKDEDGGRSSDLVGHLSSGDFFNVAEFPMASLTITGAGEGGLMADVTIKGKTNSEMITGLTMDGEAGTASGSVTIDRRKYDVVWDHPVKEMVLSDNITLDVQLVMAK